VTEKEEKVNPAINTEMKMHSDLLTYIPKKIILEEVVAKWQIGWGGGEKTRNRKRREKENQALLFNAQQK
jgi:hypothetical protein